MDPIDDNSLLDSVDELDFGNIRLDFPPSEQAVETSNDVSDISSALHRIQHLQKQFSFYKVRGLNKPFFSKTVSHSNYM